MLTKHKIWLGTGALAAAAGAVAVWPGFKMAVWPSHPRSFSGKADETRVIQSEGSGQHLTQADAPPAAGAEGKSTDTGEHGSIRTISTVQDFAGGSFAVALAEVLDGEGGKGGLGITPLTYSAGQWTFSVPALTGSQLNDAVIGNSLRSERHFALHFDRDGRYSGWSLNWSKASMARCPSKSGSNYGVFDGECWVATENTLTGTWTVRSDQLCMNPAPRGVTEGRDCVRGALMLNSLVFFGPDGRMIGKGAELLPGNNAARERKS